MSKKLTFILSGGGTGGHIYPAIAIAKELEKRFSGCKILFVGASDRMEMQKVPQVGYEIIGLWISGIQRKLTLSNLMFPFKLLSSLLKSRKILRKTKPDVVIGTGGFASGPLLRMASAANIPTLIQEQNSFPGITNKWLAKNADRICVAYDNLDRFFPAQKIVKTGNPVRQDLIEIASKREAALLKFGLSKEKQTLLVLGGSLGARRINQLIENELDFLIDQNLQIIWQCGKLYFEDYKKYADHNGVKVLEFIDTMDLAYAAADIIISRAGAGSVSELCIVGKPVLFIPSPNVAEDHQTKNAKAVVSKGGALMLREQELDRFQQEFKKVIESDALQEKLSTNIKELALPNATSAIVDEIEKIIK
ncbi:undecaprenyldiphospho-muramoylpentapeptide beta-N-acetylglucosaminyltransferase [Aquimarina brevivitae]|uniref:UDP-N-acetylglucosamine--N-acetylmuramyl-(pentapeptide) pyrophosphoryl-undecaprenol N-acetylglucosamine transferase n=1 Tax=Aquimarina brevivitae TaxID=323412 RepID=A0A4Q7NXR3_9FLAO|nr:undecaprenyldiphospho-muramoylpentapeptide beta-N-acetylglucosaminyltransferase [Aquimarina brevivitae]RZS92183.1 UDP-N-acetylglucosamine-N-acetylmuramylpentapeptide N-acetylglucosamine transferase [Aquimarina brevivitae]